MLDRDPEEQARQQSISLDVASFDWNDHRINLIDTPGYADFRGEALLGMSAADLAVFVIDGVAGVQSQDELLWRHADELGLPRMIFVNKLDRERSSFDRTLAAGPRDVRFARRSRSNCRSARSRASTASPTCSPTDAFVYDSGHAEPTPIPDDLADAERSRARAPRRRRHRDSTTTCSSSTSSGTEPSPEQLEHLLHDAVDGAMVFPVLCGSATAPIGADHLLGLHLPGRSGSW